MKSSKGLFAGITVIVVVVVAVVIVAAGGSNKNDTSSNSTSDTMKMNDQQSSKSSSSASSSSSSSTSSSNAVATNAVTISNFAFSPATITVKAGTKVTWTNQDDVRHSVSPDSPSADFSDGSLFGKGESYSFTFTKAGTYKYHCAPHPYMKGTVVVTE